MKSLAAAVLVLLAAAGAALAGTTEQRPSFVASSYGRIALLNGAGGADRKSVV